MPERIKQMTARNIHRFLAGASVLLFSLSSHREISMMSIPATCRIPNGSCQKIGPASEGMIIPYMTTREVNDMGPMVMAATDKACRENTVTAYAAAHRRVEGDRFFPRPKQSVKNAAVPYEKALNRKIPDASGDADLA